MERYPGLIADVRGKGLLLIVELQDQVTASTVVNDCLTRGLFVSQTQGRMIRLFPPLTISMAEMGEGLAILEKAISSCIEARD
jgi:acetylornithine/N-succinyldiaminopimelate aminotransferase